MLANEIDRAALRNMSPAQKLTAMNQLIQLAYELKAAGLRSMHPDWSTARVERETRRLVGGELPS